MITYDFRDCAYFDFANADKADAQVIGDELSRIAGDNGFVPDDVWMESKPKSAPLHKHFTWNLKEAAKERWRDQARSLAACIRITGEDVPFERAFISITDDSPAGRSYHPAEQLALDPAQQRLELERGVRELRTWTRRYRALPADICHLVAAAIAAGDRHLEDEAEKDD
jgi:hypothetical protein